MSFYIIGYYYEFSALLFYKEKRTLKFE